VWITERWPFFGLLAPKDLPYSFDLKRERIVHAVCLIQPAIMECGAARLAFTVQATLTDTAVLLENIAFFRRRQNRSVPEFSPET
jgi:hypothetical protein